MKSFECHIRRIPRTSVDIRFHCRQGTTKRGAGVATRVRPDLAVSPASVATHFLLNDRKDNHTLRPPLLVLRLVTVGDHLVEEGGVVVVTLVGE